MKVGIRGKLFAISLLLIVAVGLTSGAFLEAGLRSELSERIEQDLLLRARTARAAISQSDPDDPEALDTLADDLGRSSKARVTIFARDGRVLGESSDRAAKGEGLPPEVREALEAGSGMARRREAASKAEILYVATPFSQAGRVRGAVRLAIPLSEIEGAIAGLRALMLVAAAIGLVTAVFMSGVASELMSRALRTLVDNAVALVKGERSESIPLVSRDELGRLAGSFNAIAEELQGAVTDLAGERDRLQTILASMSEAVIALDDDGRIALANGAAGNVLDLTEDDIGRPLLEAIRLPALAEIAERSRSGANASTEFHVPKPPQRRLLAHAAPLRTVGGSVIVMHDVTEIRRLERVRRDFIANVSHELRTPIAVIRANAETLVDGAIEEGGEAAKRFAGGIYRNADRLSRLIADLLDLSKIEAGQYALELQPLDVEDAVEQALESVRSRLESRGVTAESDVHASCLVLADPTALEQILTNYVDNASKYTGDGGHVWVRAEETRGEVRIEVEDDGPGIEPPQRARVFERFYRVDHGRGREVGGTGLGLAIVKHLAEAMGGTVGVDPGRRRGSVFWVELPRGDVRQEDRRPTREEATAERADAAGGAR